MTTLGYRLPFLLLMLSVLPPSFGQAPVPVATFTLSGDGSAVPTTVSDPQTSPSPTDPVTLPPANPAEGSWPVEFSIQTDAFGLRWSAIPGAIRYFIEVSSDPILLHRLWLGTTETPEATVPLHGFVPHGAIYVRLQAVNDRDEPLATTVTSSFLGRQTDLPKGITGIIVTTQNAPAAPAPATKPSSAMRWNAPLFTRDLTLISGQFGGDYYTNYLLSHGLYWNGDSPSASVSTGVRLFYTANDREGFSLQRGDMNLSTYFTYSSKKVPVTLTYNGYLYRQLQGGGSQIVNSLNVGYQAGPHLTTGAQITLNPRYLSAWGSYGLKRGSLLFQVTDNDFSRAVTLTYQTQQTLK